MDGSEGKALSPCSRSTLVVCRRRGGEGVVHGVVACRVVERRRSFHGRIRTIDFEGSVDRAPSVEAEQQRADVEGPRAGEVVPGRVVDVRLQLGRLTVRRCAAKRAPSRALQLRGRRSCFCTSTWLNPHGTSRSCSV